jgi:hypothetical protein
MFSPTSRYHEIEIATYVAADGREIPYVRRRFLPPADSFSLLAEHTVTQGERLDHIAAQYLGDPEQFWRLCDVNVCLHPDELTAEIGRRLRIPLLQGG